MSGRNTGEPIGDRELDRLLALVPPPPTAPADLAERIAARAATTPQLPPLPPRRPARFARGRVLRRRTLAGAVLGSLLIAMAATAAVLGGHVDFHRLAALPSLLFDRHSPQAPGRLAATPVRTRLAQVQRSALHTPPILMQALPGPSPEMQGPPAAVSAHRAAEAALVRSLALRPAMVGHMPQAVRRHAHPEQSRALAVARREMSRQMAIAERLNRPGLPLSRPHSGPSGAGESEVAAANRESLRTAVRSASSPPDRVEGQGASAGERAESAERASGQRWRGQQRPGWRRRAVGQLGGWRDGNADAGGQAAAPAARGATATTAAESSRPGKGVGVRGAGRRGGRGGKMRQRRR